MVNNHENYYLVSIQDNFEEITYCRIENMKSIEILEDAIKDQSFIEKFSYGFNSSDNMETIIVEDLKEYVGIGGSNGTKD